MVMLWGKSKSIGRQSFTKKSHLYINSYDSWVRCLTNWEGKKNICPLTKKPLTKRDLGKFIWQNNSLGD